jgi:arginyl-tRNA synthetase
LAVDEDLSVETIENTLSQLFDDAIKTSFPSLGVPVKPAITPGRDVEKGEYQCNNAMALTKVLKDAGIPDAPRSPKEIGECIVQNLPSSAVIEGANVAPQGFINIKINKDYVQEQLYGMLKDGLQPPRQRKQRVLIDFSSPNIAKEMHVGHLRSTIIGECLSRTFEFCGHDVLRVNHVGDWGTQFGMLIAHLKDNYPDFKTNTPPISDLVAFYKESKARFDADPAFKERAQQEVVALQGGDEENLKAWRLICEVSRVEFKKIYERLEVTVEEKGESFYNPYMPSMVQELMDAKLADVSDGAKVIVSGAQVPLTDLTQADVERLLQSNLLKTPMNEQPALVQCLTNEGFVVDDQENVQCLKVGSGKKERLLALTAVDSNMGLETASKIAKGLSEALVKTQKTKQGKQLVVNAGFLDALRATPGLVSSTEEGADSVFVPAFTYPFMIQKRDGGFTYDTTDLAALRYRLDEENVERVIYVTDVGQEPHFMMLFAAAKDVGYFSPDKQRCDHVGFGLVFGPDGKKLKTREGDTIRLADLLDEAPKRSYEESVRREEEKAALAAERGETYEGLTEEELQQNANVIGYGAVKYFDLRQNRTSSYRFSYDEMLSLKGNTAVGLIYAYVRMRSIARKAGVANSDNLLTELEAQHPEGLSVALGTETEWALGLHLMRFSTTINAMTEELAPNKMTDFLYELVTKFNAFYLQESILKAEDRDNKLLLCEVTAKILKEGLRLLGIGVLEKL